MPTGSYLIPRQGTIERFWQDDEGTLWAYYLPVGSDAKEWQLETAKLDRLEKA